MKAEPHLKPEDVDELERLIEAGKRPVSYDSPFQKKRMSDCGYNNIAEPKVRGKSTTPSTTKNAARLKSQ